MGVKNPLERMVGRPRASVPDLLRARVTATPREPFLIWQGESFSYQETWERACDAAAWFADVLAKSEQPRVATYLGNGLEMMWAWLGTLLAGATFVPLNRQHKGPLLLDMLARSQAEVLITDAASLIELPDLGATDVRITLLTGDDVERRRGVAGHTWAEVHDAGRRFDPPEVAPHALAEVIYTSGTTGRSKAVQLSHNQLCRGAGWVAWSAGLEPADVFHQWMPLYHVAAQVDATLATAIAGGRVALFPTFSRSRFWQQVRESRATVFVGTSNTMQMIWDLPARQDDRATTLRVGILGAIPTRIHRAFEERFDLHLVEAYGMTEAEPIAMPEPGRPFPLGTMGKATPDFEVAIVDEYDVALPAGVVGEIVCRPRVPDVLTAGYEGDDAATVALMRNCWLHTGDMGRIDADGYVAFVDRKKHAIRHRGENISSLELETLLADHDAIAESCAVAVPSVFGDDDVKVVIVLAEGHDLAPEALHAWCTGRMARFMVPRYIEIRDSLPRNSVDRVQKHLLRDLSGRVWDAEQAREATG